MWYQRYIALDQLKSYLTGKTQSIRLNNTSSNQTNVTIGVPQGTILGPLFFIIYVNELLIKLPLNLISYADDMIILCSGKSLEVVQDSLNAILEIVGDWLLTNELSLNIN